MWETLVTNAQAVWETPRSILDSVFVRVFGAAPQSVVRISAGTSNETYSCDSGTTRLVMRVGRHSRPYFEQERWAIAAARAAGVPAPDVLSCDA
jgi:aminoglycoside phosphotransferase (APT) family kinase protein